MIVLIAIKRKYRFEPNKVDKWEGYLANAYASLVVCCPFITKLKN
jgi:hypothetical protein